MNQKKIGVFLKQLRNEKGITQEQLAEILGVSGRTVSRWETGTNLPDISILVEISEYYNVEMKEILDGERKSKNMDNELKETLLKVADYNELEKQRAARTGNISFSIMFLVCTVTIIVQMLMTMDFSLIIGETAVIKSTPKKDLMISLICVGIFSIVFYLFLKEHTAAPWAIGAAFCFFVVLSAISYALLRGISYFSQKKSDQLNDSRDNRSVVK